MNEIINATAPPLNNIVLRCDAREIEVIDGWGAKFFVQNYELILVCEFGTPGAWFCFDKRGDGDPYTSGFAVSDKFFSLDNIWFGGDARLEFWTHSIHDASVFAEYPVNGFLSDRLKTLLKRYV